MLFQADAQKSVAFGLRPAATNSDNEIAITFPRSLNHIETFNKHNIL
jgi:hypothetical protein